MAKDNGTTAKRGQKVPEDYITIFRFFPSSKTREGADKRVEKKNMQKQHQTGPQD